MFGKIKEGLRGVFSLCLAWLDLPDRVSFSDDFYKTTFSDTAWSAKQKVFGRETDNGTGMETSIRVITFEPFFTVVGVWSWTRLGLFVVYGAVQARGATLSYGFEPGEELPFTLMFPQCT